jgi:hypothetical protein
MRLLNPIPNNHNDYPSFLVIINIDISSITRLDVYFTGQHQIFIRIEAFHTQYTLKSITLQIITSTVGHTVTVIYKTPINIPITNNH